MSTASEVINKLRRPLSLTNTESIFGQDPKKDKCTSWHHVLSLNKLNLHVSNITLVLFEQVRRNTKKKLITTSFCKSVVFTMSTNNK